MRILVAVLLPLIVTANSRGVGVPCDVDIPVGSDDVNTKSNAAMWWAAKAKFSKDYTLRTGDGAATKDPTTYKPGEWTTLYLRSHVKGKQLTGLVLYAEDGKGNKPGEWSIPPNSGFYKPGGCVVHQNANYKHYRNVFKVKFPAGTGPVVIKALVKYGLANPVKDGAFFWPNSKHLLLNEAAPTSKRVWFEGRGTQSCAEVCEGVGGTCDLNAMQAEGQSATAMFAKVDPFSTCFKPLMAGCSASSPAVSPDGCFYHDAKCEPEKLPPVKTRYCAKACRSYNYIPVGTCCDFAGQVYSEKKKANQCRCLDKGTANRKGVAGCYNAHCGSGKNGGKFSVGWPRTYKQPTPPPPPTKQTLSCTAKLDWDEAGRRLCACAGAKGGPKPCSGNPCNGHGRCTGDNVCTCATGYSGKWCTVGQAPDQGPVKEKDPCCPSPCGSHGQCSGDGLCTCTQGWSGPKCTIDPCKIDSCSGHGSCSGHKGGFVCKCTGGWGGKTCGDDPSTKLVSGGGTSPPPSEPTNTGTCTNACGGKSNPRTLKPNCCPAGQLCYEKNEFWWSCKPAGECEPGVHLDDPEEYQTPWTCKVKGGKARRQLKAPEITEPSLARRLDAASATCEKGTIKGVVCACNPGYQGGGVWKSGATYPPCVKVDYCAKGGPGNLGPCLNGGVCQNLGDIREDRGIDTGLGYVCNCKCGFGDTNCQTCNAGCNTQEKGGGGGNSVDAAPQSGLAGLALAVTFALPGDTVGKLGVLALGLLGGGMLPGAHAHNWMTSPARGNERGENNGFNGFQAAPGPQRSARVHTQVGKGQKFPIEWAAGHGFGSHTYFAVVRAKDENKLKRHTIAVLDDYIKNAPNSGRDYMKEHPVYHVSGTPHNHALLKGANVAASYVWIPGDASSKGKRPSLFRRKGFGNNPQVKEKKWSEGQDQRVKYKSEKYPWIISAHRFLMKYDYPKDADTTMMEIPEEEGTGKFIVAYQWSGYYDIVDVNVLPVKSTDLFGKEGVGGNAYDRIDHCEFIPYKPDFKVVPGSCKALEGSDKADKCACTGAGCDGIQVEITKLNAAVLKAGVYTSADLPPECDSVKGGAERVCYALKQGKPVVGPPYRVSSDPEDPVFYNSCYTKATGWEFAQKCEDCPAVTIDPGWAFGQECISCLQMRTNVAPGSFVPEWTLLKGDQICRACNSKGR